MNRIIFSDCKFEIDFYTCVFEDVLFTVCSFFDGDNSSSIDKLVIRKSLLIIWKIVSLDSDKENIELCVDKELDDDI